MDYLDPMFVNLPSDWRARSIADVAEIHNKSRAPIKGLDRESMKGPYPYCGANGVVDYIDRFAYDGEYVLIAEDGGHWGRYEPSAYIMSERFWVNNHAHVLRGRENVLDNHFLLHLLTYTNIDPVIGGDARGKLTQSLLTQLILPYPPLREQRQIARVLSAMQQAIERQEHLIALTTELKKALMHKLLTEGTRGEPLKQTEMGPVPESWEVVTLGSLAKIGNGATPKRDNPAYWESGSIPWLTSGKIHEGRIKKPDQYVTFSARAECHLPMVAAGSVLIAITGEGKTLGNAALVEFDTCISQHLAYAQFHDPEIVPAFIYRFLEDQYDHLLVMGVGAGSTKKALTCGLLKRYLVPVPKKVEQQEIAEALDVVTEKIGGHIRIADSLRALFRTLLHQLMTAQVRVHDLDLSALDELKVEAAEAP
jgi:type I restriction enzyme S subunit